jgi:hypothetical protein
MQPLKTASATYQQSRPLQATLNSIHFYCYNPLATTNAEKHSRHLPRRSTRKTYSNKPLFTLTANYHSTLLPQITHHCYCSSPPGKTIHDKPPKMSTTYFARTCFWILLLYIPTDRLIHPTIQPQASPIRQKHQSKLPLKRTTAAVRPSEKLHVHPTRQISLAWILISYYCNPKSYNNVWDPLDKQDRSFHTSILLLQTWSL